MGGSSGSQWLGGRARAELRRYALGLPGAHEDFPWGESVVKVGTKVLEESYRAIAPRRLVKQLDAERGSRVGGEDCERP